MLVLPSAREQAIVEDAIGDFEGAREAPATLLFVGNEDYSERADSGEWGQDASQMALDLDCVVDGIVPRRLENAPVRFSVVVEGIILPQVVGFRSLPEGDESFSFSRLRAQTAGAMASERALKRLVEYPGVTPEFVVLDALYMLPYDRGLVRVEPVGAPIFSFLGFDGGFTRTQTVMDILSRVVEKVPYVFRDTAFGGHVASLSQGLARPRTIPFEYDSADIPNWKPPKPARKQYSEIVVYRDLPDGRDAFEPIVATIEYQGRDYPPATDLPLMVAWPEDLVEGAEQRAYDLAREHSRGLYVSDPELPFNPLLERDDSFKVREKSGDDDGFWERVWLHGVKGHRHAFGEGFSTQTECEATVLEEQLVKAPTLVLAAFSLSSGVALALSGTAGDYVLFDASLPWVTQDGDYLTFDDSQGAVTVDGDYITINA